MKMKCVGIIIFLFCSLVFSCKNAEKKLTGIQDYEEIEQRILEMAELEQIEYIAGPVFGYSGGESRGWKIYKNIMTEYSSETIEKEYFKTDSSVAKIYLYWILRERDWHNLSIIYKDLLKRGSEEIMFFPGWCVGFSIQLCEIIEENY
ncbi:MAG: hypothetical protein LBQ93_10360 [Treponema sp.]|jgi:hypothetical protein|nr:hypothetical protein [Treponema sp.]